MNLRTAQRLTRKATGAHRPDRMRGARVHGSVGSRGASLATPTARMAHIVRPSSGTRGIAARVTGAAAVDNRDPYTASVTRSQTLAARL
jgi:hypothetical protein